MFTVKKVKFKDSGKEVLALILPHYLQTAVSTNTINLVSLDGKMKLCKLSSLESVSVTRVMDKKMRMALDEVVTVAREWNKCNMYLRRGTRGYTEDRLNGTTDDLKKAISKMSSVYAIAYKDEIEKEKENKLKEKVGQKKVIRNITELVGRVVELKSDNKRYLVMPLELRDKELNAILGKIEGRVSSQDLVYKERVVIMPLDEIPEQRIKLGTSVVEGEHFVVRNIKPEEVERVKQLNNSMSLVLDNLKKVYRNLTELKELEKKQMEIESKIKKVKDINSVPLNRWSRPASKAYLLELYRNDVEISKAKGRLKDKNRPLYKTSLTGGSNATSRDVLELLKVTDKPLYYRYGFAYRGAKESPITREKAITIWTKGGLNGGFIDMSEDKDSIIINEYSSNDMW